jgi:uncharacterized repeat protein (TIGR02543 family)
MFLSGTTVTLYRCPAAGWQFAGWTGNLSGSVNPFAITMDANKSIAATFTPIPPTITTQPISQTVMTGANVSFTVAASGTPPLTYQWKKNGVSIAGATAATLSLANVQVGDSGSYTAVVSNGGGPASSNPATLTVLPPLSAPVITTQPAGRMATVGDNVSFTVVATGNPTPSYQWRKDGVNIAGANAPTLSLTNVQVGDSGAYTVFISNSEGSVTSVPATLTVPQPSIPPAITTQPVSRGASVGQNVTFAVVATGNPAPTYQWKKNGVDIAGATAATLSISNVQLADAATYTVVVLNKAGTITSNPATLDIAPFISSQPVSRTLTVGSSVSFTVVAAGSPAPTYQWKKNGVALPGATADTLMLSNVQLADAGIYTVALTNTAGSLQSSPATLSITSPGGVVIMNDSFADGERASLAPPGSATWLKAQSSTVAAVAPGSAQFTWNTTSADMISGVFTTAGSPVTLGVGDTLTLAVTFSFTGLNPTAATATPTPALRFGILDSKGTRPADNGGTSNAVYGRYGLRGVHVVSHRRIGHAFTLNRRTTLTQTTSSTPAPTSRRLGQAGVRPVLLSMEPTMY